MSANLDLARNFLKRVWEDEDSNAIYEVFTGATTVQGLEEVAQVGPEEFHAFQRMMTAQFSDIRHTILQTVEEGEWLSLLCDISAVYREGEMPVATRTQIMLRIVNGRIVEAHNQIDLVSIFESIGRLPPRTLDLCLVGAKLDLKRSA